MSELAVGGWARVIAEGDNHHGQVGKIVEAVSDDRRDGYAFYVDFPEEADLYAFMVDELEVAESQRPTKRAPATVNAPLPVHQASQSSANHADKMPDGDADDLESTPRSAPKIWILGVIGTVVLVVVLAGAIIVSLTRSDGASQGTRQSTATASGDGSTRIGNLRGSLDDWRSAVCTLGSNQPNNQFPHSTQGGACQAGRTYVAIARFDSAYLMRDDLSRTNQLYYWGTDTDGTTIVFSPISYDPSALKPLTAFGFVSATPGS